MSDTDLLPDSDMAALVVPASVSYASIPNHSRPAPAGTFRCRGYGAWSSAEVNTSPGMLDRSQAPIPLFGLFYLHSGNILANAPLLAIALNSSPVSTICASMLRPSMQINRTTGRM